MEYEVGAQAQALKGSSQQALKRGPIFKLTSTRGLKPEVHKPADRGPRIKFRGPLLVGPDKDVSIRGVGQMKGYLVW